MTYRQISQIAKCSSGAVSAEIRQMKREGVRPKESPPKVIPKMEPIESKIELEITRF